MSYIAFIVGYGLQFCPILLLCPYPGAAIDACHVGTQWDKVQRGDSGRWGDGGGLKGPPNFYSPGKSVTFAETHGALFEDILRT